MDVRAALPPSLRRWDIFCRVVDNFGDAGVAWRLARELAIEHAIRVTLWIDQPGALARIAPGIDPALLVQRRDGIEVRRLAENMVGIAAAPVVVEAFGCGLPDAYVDAMAAARSPPQWFVLEYLTAEHWIESAHGLSSIHPRSSLERRFWFPGFAATTGGLLREASLFQRQNAFVHDASAHAQLWHTLQMPAPPPSALRVSLFCYPDAPVAALLEVWAAHERPVVCMVPDGVASNALTAWRRGPAPRAGAPIIRGQLTLHTIPFLEQDRYDELLWACDLNFVRGEDSFVRAQWAGKPLAWHIYPQNECAHHAKLAAFLDRYTHDLPPAAAAAIRTFSQAWNGVVENESGPAIGPAWQSVAAALPQLASHAATWAAQLAALPELASGLVAAAQPRV